MTKPKAPKTTPTPAPFAVPLTFTAQQVADLLVTALEGGTNYWLRIDRMVRPPKGAPVWRHAPDLGGGEFPHIDYPLSGGYLAVTDIEEGKKYRLDRAAIERGLALMPTKAPSQFGAWLAGDDDSTTGDCFVQCALLGDVIYG